MHAPEGGENAGERQADPERQTEGRRQQGVGIGADRVEGDIAEVEQAGEADDDVEAPAQHHIDQDLDAVAVDPFERAGRPSEPQRANGKTNRNARPMASRRSERANAPSPAERRRG